MPRSQVWGRDLLSSWLLSAPSPVTRPSGPPLAEDLWGIKPTHPEKRNDLSATRLYWLMTFQLELICTLLLLQRQYRNLKLFVGFLLIILVACERWKDTRVGCEQSKPNISLRTLHGEPRNNARESCLVSHLKRETRLFSPTTCVFRGSCWSPVPGASEEAGTCAFQKLARYLETDLPHQTRMPTDTSASLRPWLPFPSDHWPLPSPPRDSVPAAFPALRSAPLGLSLPCLASAESWDLCWSPGTWE